MLLAVDIGNTNITLGIFNENKIVKTFRLISDKTIQEENYVNKLKEMFSDYNIDECVIGSVVEQLTKTLKSACDKAFNLDSYVVSNSIEGMKLLLKNPNEAGVDRIANAYGAKKLYSLPAIVVDIGTAATFDIVSKDGDFLGGVIMPGINLQLKSLNMNTSKLPEIEVKTSPNAIGNCTENAILSGVIRGSACAIEGLIHQCEQELGEKAVIIATGGHSSLVANYMTRKFDYINPSLTLEGLKFLYKDQNAKKLPN